MDIATNPEEEAALAALRASPLVRDIGPIGGSRPGLYARLWCARAEHPSRDSEQVKFSAARTTMTQCARDLLALVHERHGGHMAAANAERLAHAEAADGPSAPTDAFATMAAAQQVQPAMEAAKEAERSADQARRAKRDAEKALEQAAKAAEEAENEARRLEDEANSARRAAGLGEKQARVEEADAEPSWRSWTISKWNELETKEQARRREQIDCSRTEIVAPKQAGDESRGWWKHWRRG